MMPSSFEQSWNASSACLSVAERVGDAAASPSTRNARGRCRDNRGRRRSMAFVDLPVLVHQEIGAIAVQHAGLAAGEARRHAVPSTSRPCPAASTPYHLDGGIVEERV